MNHTRKDNEGTQGIARSIMHMRPAPSNSGSYGLFQWRRNDSNLLSL